MLKNELDVSIYLEKVKKVKNYGNKTVKILQEISKTTNCKVYGKEAIRLVASGKWFNDAIYNAMLLLLKQEIDLANNRNKLIKEVNKGFQQLSKTA